MTKYKVVPPEKPPVMKDLKENPNYGKDTPPGETPGDRGKYIVKKDMKLVKKQQFELKIWKIGHFMCLVFGVLFSLAFIYKVGLNIYYTLIFYKFRNWKFLFLTQRADYKELVKQQTAEKLQKYKSYGWFDYKFYLNYLLFKRFLLNFTIWYKFSCLGSIIAHVVTLNQYTRSTFLSLSYYDLFTMVNFQYLSIIILWFLTYPSIFKLFPYLVLSYIQVFNKTNDHKLTSIIPYSELLTFIPLVYHTLVLKPFAGFALVGYLAVFWLKLNFNGYTQIHILKIFQKIDAKIPPKYQEQWSKIKKIVLMRIGEKYRKKHSDLKIGK
ncbi:hypothetical protein ACO0RG_000088 [Hanseniaspora osmophila]